MGIFTEVDNIEKIEMESTFNKNLPKDFSIAVVCPFPILYQGYRSLLEEMLPGVTIHDLSIENNKVLMKDCELIIFQMGADHNSQLENLLHFRDDPKGPKVLVLLEKWDEYILKMLAHAQIEGIILLKNTFPKTLKRVFEQIVIENKIFIDPEVVNGMAIHFSSRSKGERLKNDIPISNKQIQIIELSAQGYTSKDVASILASSRSNITQHKTRIIQILNVRNMQMAVTKCLFNRYITLQSLYQDFPQVKELTAN